MFSYTFRQHEVISEHEDVRVNNIVHDAHSKDDVNSRAFSDAQTGPGLAIIREMDILLRL